MRILVTGGAGFIGSHLVEAFVRAGHRVRVLDSLFSGKRSNLEAVRDQVDLMEGDCTDPAVAAAAVEGAEAVYHEAAVPSVARSVKDPLLSHQTNPTATLTMLEAARAAGVRRFVFAGSSSVYGDSPELPKREDMPTRPLSPYGVGKLSRRALRARVREPVRHGDADAALLQRVRSPAGSGLALQRRHLALRDRDAAR